MDYSKKSKAFASPITITCSKCHCRFSSHRGYSIHLSRSEKCIDHLYSDELLDPSSSIPQAGASHVKSALEDNQNDGMSGKRRRLAFDVPPPPLKDASTLFIVL